MIVGTESCHCLSPNSIQDCAVMVYRPILSRDLSDLLQGRRMERLILHQDCLMQICVNEGSQIPLKLPVCLAEPCRISNASSRLHK
jgi:hypothetical protein